MNSHCRTLLLLTCLLGPSALMVACRSWPASDGRQADDGWRRTADGWERASQWPSKTSAWFSPKPRSAPVSSLWRYDSHPAALAFGQLGLIILGFYAFPAPGRAAGSLALKRWPSAVASSFRASLFGA